MDQSRSADQSLPVLHSLASARLLDRLLRSAVPESADFAMVHVRAGRAVVGVAAAHDRREQTRTLRELLRIHRLRASDGDSTVAQVIRTGRALVRSDIRPESRSAAHQISTGRIAELHRRLATRSALVVPIVVRGVVLGALSLGYSHSARRYTSKDVATAELLAVKIGYVLMATTNPRGPVRVSSSPSLRQATILKKRPPTRN